MSAQEPILIAGATASGKSELALALAGQLDGTIINADSMQVYRELRVLTARPGPIEEARAPHALYGHAGAQEAYSAGRYVVEARAALADAQACGRRAIIVGGTGLYFKALTEGLSPIPPVSGEVRRYWRDEAERQGPSALHAILLRRDPVMAGRLRASDTQRIVRALEVLDSSGRSLAHWQAQPGEPVVDAGRSVKLRVVRDREELHARAGARFDAMMREGALEEAAALAALGLDPSLPAMRALGVAPLMAAARGDLALSDAVAQAKAETRAYIKRQETWLRRHMVSWKSISKKEMESLAANCLPFIDR